MPIDRMIVVAGPKAVGKSQLMSYLKKGSLPQLAEALEMGDSCGWCYGSGADFQNGDSRERIRNTRIERFVFHYEFTGPWNPRYYAHSYAEDRPLEILDYAREITCVHLWAPCDVLLNRFLDRNPRFQSGIMWLRYLYWHGFKIRRLDADFRSLYSNPDELIRVYLDWIQFCERGEPKRHWLIDASDEQYRFAPLVCVRDDLLKYINTWSNEQSVTPAPPR